MKTYDYIIRVSKLGNTVVSAESTMTVDDQRARARDAIDAAGCRIGKEHLALNVSGFSAADLTEYRVAINRIRHGECDGIASRTGSGSCATGRAGPFYETLSELGAEALMAGMPGVDYIPRSVGSLIGMQAVAAEVTYFTNKERR